MSRYFLCVIAVVFVSNVGNGQVLQFGTCPEVETMRYFDLERFLGQWYEVARFPTWYEDYGACAYKRIQYCGRRIEIEHVFVRHGIQFVLHVNSSYTPGDEAVFAIQENNIDMSQFVLHVHSTYTPGDEAVFAVNIDPVGIPLNVIATDYTNYALVYGCRNNTEIDLKYTLLDILGNTNFIPVSAWILSREPTLSDDILHKAYAELNAVPNANVAFLEIVEQRVENCNFYWTAHVQAVDTNTTDVGNK